MPSSGSRSRRLVQDGENWLLRARVTLSEMELVAILATHATRFGGPSLELAPDEVGDRVRAFVLTYGRDSAQDTLTLPDWAVGWARRTLTAYRQWVEAEDARALTGTPTRTSQVRRLPDE